MNNQKAVGAMGQILIMLVLGSFLVGAVLPWVLDSAAFASTSTSSATLKNKISTCMYEYEEKVREGKPIIDLDKDECLDPYDVCLGGGTSDDDEDGVPNECDYLKDNPRNTLEGKAYSQRLLCTKAGGIWNENKRKCCVGGKFTGKEKELILEQCEGK